MLRNNQIRITLYLLLLGMMSFSTSLYGVYAHSLGAIVVIISIVLHIFDGKQFLNVGIVAQIAYLYLIVIEGIFNADYIRYFAGGENYNEASCYITGAMAALMVGYYLFEDTKKLKLSKVRYVIRNEELLIMFIVFAIIFYTFFNYREAYLKFTYGRNYSYIIQNLRVLQVRSISQAMIETISQFILLVLPAIISYYLCNIKGKSIWYAVALSSPLLAFAFIDGSRVRFMIPVIALTISSGHLFRKQKRLLLNFAVVILIVGTVSFMQYNLRTYGFNRGTEVFSDIELAPRYSVENAVRTLSLFVGYMRNADYYWGTQSSFILYFWIPRAIWPDKPALAGNVLIREILEFNNSYHSAASTFASGGYLDFGYFGGIILYIFWGVLLRKIGEFVDHNIYNFRNPDVIVAGIILGLMILFVRSLATAVNWALPIILMYYMVKFVFFKKVKVSA